MLYTVIILITLGGINHQGGGGKYMAITKPAYRIVGLQQKKVRKRNHSKMCNLKLNRWLLRVAWCWHGGRGPYLPSDAENPRCCIKEAVLEKGLGWCGVIWVREKELRLDIHLFLCSPIRATFFLSMRCEEEGKKILLYITFPPVTIGNLPSWFCGIRLGSDF